MPATPTALFIQERQYLKNVSQETIVWYKSAFLAFDGCDLDHLLVRRYSP